MRKIASHRVYFRLAHGQIAYAWVTYLNAKKVVIMDKDTVHDKLALAMMRASLRGSIVEAYDIADGVEQYKKDKFGHGNIICIYRNIANAYAAFKAGFDVDHLNVAQVPKGEKRRLAVATVCLSDEELKMLEEMHAAGVNIYCHQTPANPKYSFEQIVNGMKGNQK